ncbi:MAG: hypothetical protein NT075_13100 [Chloroflexi bacterium]|nr:hypothetical protein [Chloroflexota bacterium]
MTWTRRDWLLLVAVTLLAATLRFYKLGIVPPGFQFDEAFNAIDAGHIIDGNRPLFLPANAGREALYSYFQAGLAALFGLNVYSLRLASALAGIAAIPATYLLLRRLLQRHSQKIAAFTSLTLAISLWHIHFSHYGIRVITMPPLLCAIFGLYWVGMRGRQRDKKRGRQGEGETRRGGGEPITYHSSPITHHFWALLGCGLLTGISVWTHPTGRFVPFVLICYALWLWGRYPERRRWSLDNPLFGLLLTGAPAFLVFLPLGLEFYHHPEWFMGHASEVSVFAGRVSGDSPVWMLLQNVLRVLGMFSVQGDREWAHNLAGRPVFDPLMSMPFMIGLFIWGRRLWRRASDPDGDALLLLLLWTLVMLAPSIFSEAAPNYSRTLPALPAVFLAAGLGLTWLANLTLRRSVATKYAGLGVVGLILMISAGLASYDYFVRFPQRPEVYYLYDADKLDALTYLNGLAEKNEVYLDQLWADHPPVRFMRSSKLVKSLDMSDTLVLPPVGRGGVYAFPAEKAKNAIPLAKLWPGVQAENINDHFGHLLLGMVKVDAAQLATWPATQHPTSQIEAKFDDAPTLLGMQTMRGSSTITLFWRAEAQTRRSLTTFIHLLDAEGRRVGQSDKLPGNDSYLTTVWSVGERIIDRHYPAISDPCAGGEEVRVQVGWYEQAANGARRPRVDASGDTALAGHMTLPIDSYAAGQITLPNALNLPVRDNLTLLAYAIEGTGWQAGAPLIVDLFWRGNQALAEQKIGLQMANQQAAMPLWTGAIAPGATWRDGETICRRLRLRLPADLVPGAYQLELTTPEQKFALHNLTIGPSTRNFTVPTLAQTADITFGEAIKWLGYQKIQSTNSPKTLTVPLIWQALSTPQNSYTVFVHLLNEQGKILAQSDALPQNGYTTEQWVAGEIVTDTHTIALPVDIPAGRYRLEVGLYDAISGQRLPATDRAGNALPAGVVLGEVDLPLEQ